MSPETKQNTAAPAASPQADGGAYEFLRARLLELCNKLRGSVENLNAKRKDVFGGMDTVLASSTRINTEHACVPRDIRHVGKKLVIGYDVFLGLKKDTDLHDVLSVYNFDGAEFAPLGVDFLNEPRFLKDFKEIFQYYKGAKIWQIRNTGKHLLLIFKTGERAADFKVLRWVLSPNGSLEYVDNRGERDHVFPPQHDFEWSRTTREMHVFGNHPHISIKDIVFVECVGSDLTVKVENNTESGKGIYSEPVENPDQSLDDAEIYFAVLENLVLLKIRPFGEQKFRGIVFSRLMQRARRIDTITDCCVRLPEGHGVLFPGGYFLQTGECREFAENVEGMEFLKSFKSSNGEDILYVFYHRESGRYQLMQYNLVRKECNAPIQCHGFSLFPDGKLVVFKNAGNEPARSHAVQIWTTPFVAEGHEMPVQGQSYLAKIGNRDLVNGISDAFSVVKLAVDAPPSSAAYLDLVKQSSNLLDRYHWLGHEEAFGLAPLVKQIADASNSIVDEFEKVLKIQQGTRTQIEKFATELESYFNKLRTETLRGIDAYVSALAELRKRRGHLISLRELRYTDLPRLETLEKKLAEFSDGLSQKTVEFLLGAEALAPYSVKIDELQKSIEALTKVADAGPLSEQLDEMGTGLDLLAEIINNLKIDDATARTAIVEALSGIYSLLNRAKAQLAAKRKELLGRESIAEFGAQFKLLGQGLANSISLCDAPDKCDDYLGKLLVHVEELEGRFGDFPEFIEKIAEKRDEIYNAFSTRKQSLLDERQRKAGALFSAADRILKGVQRRAQTIASQDEMNGYFAADAMVLKIGETIEKLRELGDSVKADELQSRVKSAREEAMRTLRDKLEIFEDGANVVKFGKYRFSVNVEPLDVSLVLRDDTMHFHITGSDYNQPVSDKEFLATKALWSQELVSENGDVYRGEYLAYRILRDAESSASGLSLEKVLSAAGPGIETETDEALAPSAELLELIRSYSSNLYDEGYSRGIHDHDAGAILAALLRLRQRCGLLRFSAIDRAAAALFWQRFDDDKMRQLFVRKAQNLGRMQKVFNSQSASSEFIAQLSAALKLFYETHAVPFTRGVHFENSAEYLFQEISAERARGFICSQDASDFQKQFLQFLKEKDALSDFESDLKALNHDVSHAAEIARVWLEQFIQESGQQAQPHWVDESLGLLLTQGKLERITLSAGNSMTVAGLLGQHRRIESQRLAIRLDEFLARLGSFARDTVPAFRAYQQSRKEMLERERARLKLEEFKPKTMSAFVRNKLINEVYLPLIGENFAKQLGEIGANKRTDQMGLLLLISPPGYGKTTLMEYVASRLGLTFVKINGPALGTQVLSLDPAEAPNATAREEIEKLNLAFELGNNVMIYVDDIQHTNPEFLQKFISLCDAQRKIEGVYQGRTRTYDFRGKKVAVVMAGNPYTESGARFQIPDMLANRADTYNLGDIIGGRSDLFELSYLENCITSSPLLRSLAARGLDDFYKLYDMSRGGSVAETDLGHDYSAAELKDILDVLRKLKVAQDCVLKVNKEYIYSASQKDEFRTEPPFKLQGSYRNMNKIAGKVLPVMTDPELRALIQDHYVGEAQALAGGAENNLLKLAETLGTMKEKERARYDDIKRAFKRHQVLGGAGGDDKAALVVAQLASFNENLENIRGVIEKASDRSSQHDASEMKSAIAAMAQSMQKIQSHAPAQANGQPSIEIVNTLPPHYTNILQQYQKTVEWLLIPMLKSIQDQQKNNDELRGQFDALNENLKKMIGDLGAQKRRARKGSTDEVAEESGASATGE